MLKVLRTLIGTVMMDAFFNVFSRFGGVIGPGLYFTCKRSTVKQRLTTAV
jgi:hypothetical protein